MINRIIIQYTDGSIHEPLSSKTTFCTVHGNIYNDARYIYGNQTRSLEVGKEYNPDDSDKDPIYHILNTKNHIIVRDDQK